MADVADELWGTGEAGLIDRVRELEGLLASTTRRLEAEQRRTASLEDELGDEPRAFDLAEAADPEHLAQIDAAIARLATWLADADGTSMEADDLMALVKDSGETALGVIAGAISTLAVARDRLTPRPLPPIPRPVLR